MSKSSAQVSHIAVVKTSSIFDVEQIRNMRHQHDGNSTTSFSYEPAHPDDKIMASTKRTVFEPTYRLEPLVKVKSHVVKDIIDSVLKQHLEEKVYSPEMAAEEAKLISSDVQKQVKRLRTERYKYVVHVTIGQKRGQSFDIGSRCCWNTDNDSMASATLETPTFFAVAIVFALYYE